MAEEDDLREMVYTQPMANIRSMFGSPDCSLIDACDLGITGTPYIGTSYDTCVTLIYYISIHITYRSLLSRDDFMIMILL